MITSIEIQNLRGIADGKLEGLTKLTVLIGPNGSGKSTVLDAIWITSSAMPGAALQSVVHRHSGTGNPAKWFIYKASKGMSTFVRSQVWGDESRIELKWNDLKNDLMMRYFLSGRDIWHKDLNYQSKNVIDANFFREVKMLGKFSGLAQPSIHDLYSEMIVAGRGKEAISLIQEILPKIDDVKILTENGSPYLFLSYSDHSVPIAIAGDGVFALAQLGLELALRSGGIALIEEPEIHLHSAAIRQTAKVIWGAIRNGVQVVLTTHSIELIDGLLDFVNDDAELEKLSVFRTKLDEGHLKVSRIAGVDVEFARHQIGDDLR